MFSAGGGSSADPLTGWTSTTFMSKAEAVPDALQHIFPCYLYNPLLKYIIPILLS